MGAKVQSLRCPGDHPVRLFFFLLMAILLLPGCAGKKASSTAQTVLFARGSDSTTLDPALTSDSESSKVCEQIYEGLVQYREGSTAVEPALARSWEVSPDGLTWTFHLQPGVKFHDGAPFNAEAVRLSYERQIIPQHPARPKGTLPYADSTLGMIKKIQVVDALAVRFVLKHPYSPFLFNLAMGNCTPIVSPTAVLPKAGRSTPPLGEHPVGTGPYTFVSWKKGQEIILQANPNYRGGEPRIKKLIFRVISDPHERALALLRGEADLIDGIDPSEIPSLKEAQNIRFLASPGMNISYLGFRLDHPPLDRRDVREAISLALDLQSLLSPLYGEAALAARGPLPPTLFGSSTSLPPHQHDLAAARRLLKKAGYAKGLTLELFGYKEARPYNPAGEKLVRAIQQELQKAGITLNLVILPWEEYLKAIDSGKGSLFLLGWIGDNGDPDNFLYPLFHSRPSPTILNPFHYANKKVDWLLEEARKSKILKEREKDYGEVQQILIKDLPAVFLSHTMDMMATRSQVFGLTLHPTGRLTLWKVSKL